MQTNIPRIKRSPFRMGPQATLLATVLVAAGFGLWMIQFENLTFVGLLIIVGFFVFGITFKRSWSIYLMFATLLFLKFSEFMPQQGIRQFGIGWMDLLFTLVFMTFAGLCFRYLQLSKLIRAYYPGTNLSAKIPEKLNYQFPTLFGGRWWLIPVAVFIAACLLWEFPHDPQAANKYWITPTGARMIFLTFFLFIVWFVCRSVVSIVLRWNISAEQADIRARSLIANEFWNVNFPVEKRRTKLRGHRDPY